MNTSASALPTVTIGKGIYSANSTIDVPVKPVAETEALINGEQEDEEVKLSEAELLMIERGNFIQAMLTACNPGIRPSVFEEEVEVAAILA